MPLNKCTTCGFTLSCTCAASSGICSTLKHYSIQWFWLQIAKALIRLHECAVWSGPLLSGYAWKYIFAWHGPYMHLKTHLIWHNGQIERFLYHHSIQDFCCVILGYFPYSFSSIFLSNHHDPEGKPNKKKCVITSFYRNSPLQNYFLNIYKAITIGNKYI